MFVFCYNRYRLLVIGRNLKFHPAGFMKLPGFIYTFLLYLLLPLMLLRLLLRSIKTPAYRQRWQERLGIYRVPRLNDSIWIHTVSVGETQAAEPLVRRILAQRPELRVVITTTTPTGSDRAKKLFGDVVSHVYFPFDIPFAINGFLGHFQPRMLIMMETEIWPNLLKICQENGVDTVLANARLSEGSARGYGRLGGFTRDTFGRIGLVAAQAPGDAERFLALGANPDRVRVTGSIKFDIRLPASLQEQAEVMRRQWAGRPVWVAASTHEGEDEQVIAAHRLVKKIVPDALLVLVPRHPERFDRVASLCRREGFVTARRSDNDPVTRETEIFLGDTMGELPQFLAAADASFMGGSLMPIGGHNVLEPAALGLPVVFGPHMFNFGVISSMLLAEEAAVQIGNDDELADVISRWLQNASARTEVGERGRKMVEDNRGALDRLCALVEEELG